MIVLEKRCAQSKIKLQSEILIKKLVLPRPPFKKALHGIRILTVWVTIKPVVIYPQKEHSLRSS